MQKCVETQAGEFRFVLEQNGTIWCRLTPWCRLSTENSQLAVEFRLQPMEAGRIADALEDLTTVGPPKRWGVYRRNAAGDGTDNPVFLVEFDTYQAAMGNCEARRRVDTHRQEFSYQYFYQAMEEPES